MRLSSRAPCATAGGEWSLPLAVFEKIRCAPEVEGGGGSMGAPLLTETLQLLGLGQLPLFVSDLKSTADTQVVNGQHVGPAEVENQKHFGGPAADTFDFGKGLEEFLIGSLVAFIEGGDEARSGAFSDLEDVASFGT